MSVAVLQRPNSTLFNHLNKCSWPEPPENFNKFGFVEPEIDVGVSDDEEPQFDMWNSMQATRKENDDLISYVYPMMKRSSSMLSQRSLELCTESLGSETGSDEFCDELIDYYSIGVESEKMKDVPDINDNETKCEQQLQLVKQNKGKVVKSVNYHSSRSHSRSFPPPLPSICRRDGPCIQMRPHRRDGRLVVEAVSVPSQNYLHAQREGGRLTLSIINAVYDDQELENFDSDECEKVKEVDAEVVDEVFEDFYIEEGPETKVLDDEDDEEEEEVEVVDRGTVVEVKVSRQTSKVHRSSLVINKFVGGMPSNPVADCEQDEELENMTMKLKNNITTTAAAAVVAATTLSVPRTVDEDYDNNSAAAMLTIDGDALQFDNKLLFTSKRRNRKELLHNMRRCSQLRRPLFIWEPYSIPTSSWA